MRNPAPALTLLIAPLLAFDAPRPAQEPNRSTEFLNGWKAAEEVGDIAEQEKLLQKYRQEALVLFLQKIEARALHPEDEPLNKFCDRFTEIWTNVTKSNFPRVYDRYLQRLTDPARVARDRYINQELPVVNRLHIAAIQKTEDVPLTQLRDRCDLLVQNIENLGDLYYIAFACNIQGNLWNPRVLSTGADGTKALAAYARAMEARKQLELTNDSDYASMERMWKELKFALGIVDPGEEAEAAAATFNPEEMKPADGVTWTAAPLTFGSEKKAGTVAHANDLSDEAFHSWMRAGVSEVGESREIPGLASNVHIFIEHLATDRIRLIAGGEPGKEVRLASKPVETEVQIKLENGSTRPFRLLLAGGGSSDVLQGVQMNLQMTDEGGALFFRSPSVYAADTPFGEFTVYDANTDGWFGYAEMVYDWTDGLLPDTWFYSPDAITLGSMKHSLPFSRFIRDDAGQWYEVKLDSVEAPSKVELLPVSANLGKLRVDFKGLKKMQMASCLLVSESSATKGLVLDLACWRGPEYSVPLGRYTFRQARFTEGKNGEMLVLPHPTLPMSVDVGAEGVATLELGEPFTLTGTAVADEANVLTVNGLSLHVVGKAGERYVRFWGAPLYGVEASAKGAKTVELQMPTSEEANTDWQRLYYPKDALLELKKAGSVVIELALKKHPWFGKLAGEIKT
jgi:hypothetical protein